MFRLQEYIFAIGFFNLYKMEQLINTYCFDFLRPDFRYTEK